MADNPLHVVADSVKAGGDGPPGHDKGGTAKIGKHPIWIYGAVAVVLVVGYAYWRSRTSSTAAVDTTATDPTTVDTGNAGTEGNGLLNVSPDLTAATPAALTSGQWLSAALQHMNSNGSDPVHALSALTAFLNGGDLSWADQQIVDQAVNQIGLPDQFAGYFGNLAPNPQIAIDAAKAAAAKLAASNAAAAKAAAAKAAAAKAAAAKAAKSKAATAKNYDAHLPTIAAVNANRKAHKLPAFTQAQYLHAYPRH